MFMLHHCINVQHYCNCRFNSVADYKIVNKSPAAAGIANNGVVRAEHFVGLAPHFRGWPFLWADPNPSDTEQLFSVMVTLTPKMNSNHLGI